MVNSNNDKHPRDGCSSSSLAAVIQGCCQANTKRDNSNSNATSKNFSRSGYSSTLSGMDVAPTKMKQPAPVRQAQVQNIAGKTHTQTNATAYNPAANLSGTMKKKSVPTTTKNQSGRSSLLSNGQMSTSQRSSSNLNSS
jgi:hypothetical protein